MRGTPGLGLAAGVMYLLNRQRGRRHRRTVLTQHPWSVFGAVASVLAAGIWGLRRHRSGPIRMATTVRAPVERVFDAWARFEDFPQFMPMVAQVRPVGNDRWHWTIGAPGGASMEFVSSVTQRDRPRLIAWVTEGSAAEGHSGTVRFRPRGERETRLEIEISRPASGGAAREGGAAAAGLDPERALREALVAFKTRLEAAPHQAA